MSQNVSLTNYQARSVLNFCNDLLAGKKRVLVFEDAGNGILREKATGRLFHRSSDDYHAFKTSQQAPVAE
jgi:hypothetical protein